VTGDTRPYLERSYHGYGRTSRIGDTFSFEIDCFGYVNEESDRLRERLAREGGDGLTGDQWHAVEAVLRYTPLWDVHHNLLAIYGLPRDRESLEALVGKR
jgi:hypothetical protein